jgi:hypothetical protein
MFFDNNLNRLENFNEMIWSTGYGNFDTLAKQSQLIYYFSKLNLNKKICLIEEISKLDLDKINSSDVDLVIVNVSDHVYGTDYLDINKPCLLLGSDFNKENYHPYHLFFSSYCAKSDEVNFSDFDKAYLVSFVNRNARLTRIYLLDELIKRKYTNFQYKWFSISESNSPVPEYNYDQLVETLGAERAQSFSQYEKIFPAYFPLSEFRLCSGINDYADSYMNIVSESVLDDVGFLTEKIYKPIRAGQLFLVQAAPGSVGFLRRMGFDVFDDIIDHSYDTIPDWKTRTDVMLKELDRIYDQILTLYKQTIFRRKHNQRRLLSEDLILDCLPKI